jgi:RNA polymerase sigma-70 factor, ECF subfamily
MASVFEPSSISSTLLEQMRARRPEAWGRLVDLYGPTVYRWCRQLGVRSADAADVVQDVFSAVASGVERFRRDRPTDCFGGWLRTITRNKVVDYLRRRAGVPEAQGGTAAQRQMLEVPAVVDPSSVSMTPLQTDHGFVRRALEVVRAEFEPRSWDAFWRIAVDGESPAETAAALGMTLPAVYQAKSRVLRRLRREVNDSRE